MDKYRDTAWIGCVVPKRLARRAVTRNLIKRQIRAVADECAALLPAAAFVMRLNRPFGADTYLSAASGPLRSAVRAELCGLLGRVPR